MNEIKDFESRYEEKEIEMIVLTSNTGASAGKGGKEKMWTVYRDIIAYVDAKSGKVINEKINLCRICREEERAEDLLYKLDKLKSYKVKCRKMKDRNNYFMLVDVLESNVENAELLKIKNEYERVVEFTDEKFGKFILDKEMGWFDGNVDWLGENCRIHLRCDANENENADGALELFKKVYGNLAEFDKKIREFAANELLDNANDWLYDSLEDDEIDNFEELKLTNEKFAEKMGIREFDIDSDGEYSVFFDDGDMFWGHSIYVEGNYLDDEIRNADLFG